MKVKDIQVPKGVEFSCSIADFSRITEFVEPDDVVNVGGYYNVRWDWGVYKGVSLIRDRRFKSLTYSNQFVDLLKDCDGVKILDGPTFGVEVLLPEFNGKRMVNAYGSIEEAVRGII